MITAADSPHRHRWLFATVLAVFVALCSTVPAVAATSAPLLPVTIKTANGPVRGITVDGSREWLGLPYAAPPVGSRRWAPPAPAASWTKVRDASHFGSPCIQATTAYDTAQGSENCLYLNVYTPAHARANASLPVMVWLHGGGFVNGSGNDFDGRRLANTANAVVVTINYRLGPFGWLALGSLSQQQDGTSGNYGLLDQIAALTWLHRNITAFGGDPHLVTLFGQSAGGESALALVASPLATGLFQRAIAQSAPAGLTLPTLSAADTRNNDNYATSLGCTNPATQVACLRKIPAAKALAAGHESWNLIGDLGLYWTPVVNTTVLPDQWLSRFRAGTFNKVPVMIGQTRNEGRLFTAIYENANGHAVTASEYLNRGSKFFGPAVAAVAALYNPVTDGSYENAISDVITDGLFAAGDNLDRDALVDKGDPAVYSYEFTDPTAPDVEVKSPYLTIGDGHDSELPYLFGYRLGRDAPRTSFTSAEQTISAQMGRYWGNFARTGNPNGVGLPTWPRFTSGLSTPTQELKPGGATTEPADHYYNEHNLAFWSLLLQAQSLTSEL